MKSGVAWAVAASLATAATHASMSGLETHPFITAFWRNAFCLVLILPVIAPARAWRNAPGALPRHFARGVANTIAMVMLITGLIRMPLAEATALTFAVPIFVVIGGAIFLRERPSAIVVFAAMLGFAGVLTVAPPGPGWIGSGGSFLLGAAIFFAASMLIGRSQTRYADNMSILFYLYVLLALFSFPLALSVWAWPSPAVFAQLALVAVFSVAAHGAAVTAVRLAEASTVAPYDYLRLVWAAAIGVALFGETLSASLLIGGGMIIAAALTPVAARRLGYPA